MEKKKYVEEILSSYVRVDKNITWKVNSTTMNVNIYHLWGGALAWLDAGWWTDEAKKIAMRMWMLHYYYVNEKTLNNKGIMTDGEEEMKYSIGMGG